MDLPFLQNRPLLIAIAGPNGAGKSTFYSTYLSDFELPFLNADVLAREFESDPYAAAATVDSMRRQHIASRESFVFETVFSDPVGDKLMFLKDASRIGYTVVLFFIGVSSPTISEERVEMRVSQGGHNVPREKLQSRFSRILANLKGAIRELPHVLVYDNDDLSKPYHLIATANDGVIQFETEPLPEWFRAILEQAGP
jgi:predicted ABC-type ATPase